MKGATIDLDKKLKCKPLDKKINSKSWNISKLIAYNILRKQVKGDVNMKAWLKWLSECEYKFVRTDDGTGNAREYIFENRIRVIKGETGKGSRGGMVEVDGFTTFHGSVKELIKRVEEILSK